MRKPLIGIITYRNIGEDDRPYSDFIKFQSVYVKYLMDNGAIPIGLSFPYGEFDVNNISMCDGFLFTGGSLIESYQIEVLDYAIKNKKPVLAICNGLQTIGAYEWLRKKFDYKIDSNKIEKFYEAKNEIKFLHKVENHNKLNPFYLSRIKESKHYVMLDKEYEKVQWYLTCAIKESQKPFVCIINSEAITIQPLEVAEDGSVIMDFTNYEINNYYLCFFIKDAE